MYHLRCKGKQKFTTIMSFWILCNDYVSTVTTCKETLHTDTFYLSCAHTCLSVSMYYGYRSVRFQMSISFQNPFEIYVEKTVFKMHKEVRRDAKSIKGKRPVLWLHINIHCMYIVFFFSCTLNEIISTSHLLSPNARKIPKWKDVYYLWSWCTWDTYW